MKRAKSSEHYIRYYAALYTSDAWRTLPGNARKLWGDVRTQFRGNNNGQLLVTRATMQAWGWSSQGTLHAALRALLQRGLLRYTRYCGPNVFHRASLYAFTDLDIARSDDLGIAGSPAKHDYKEWREGRSFDLRDGAPDTAAGTAFCVVRKSDENGSENRTDTGPKSGQRTPKTGPKSGQRANQGKARKPNAGAASRGNGTD